MSLDVVPHPNDQMSLREFLTTFKGADGVIRDSEMALADPEVRGSRTRVESLLHPDFTETGSSGESYDRETMVEMMISGVPGEVVIRDFEVDRISDEVAIARYRSVGVSGQEVRRTSIWVNTGERWQLRHHQGTKVADRWGPVS